MGEIGNLKISGSKICYMKNTFSQRQITNLTDEQRTYLLGKLYEARKHTEKFKGNQYVDESGGSKICYKQNNRFPNGRTKRKHNRSSSNLISTMAGKVFYICFKA